MNKVSEPTVVFHYVSGTAQSALTRLIYQSFVVVHDEPDGFGAAPQSAGEILKVDVNTLSAAKLFLFRGHMSPLSYFLRDLYPEVLSDDRYFCFTFLGDPIRLEASIYQHLITRPDESASRWGTFEQFLKTRPANPISTVLGCRWWNYRRVMGRYSFIGVGEKFEDSVRLLVSRVDALLGAHSESSANARRARFFLKKFLEKPFPPDQQPEIDAHVASLGAAALRKFKSRNATDYRVYQHALASLSAGI